MKKKGTRRCLHKDTKSLITPSLHLCFFQDHNITLFHRQLDVKMLCCLLCLTNKQTNNMLKQNKDVGMGL